MKKASIILSAALLLSCAGVPCGNSTVVYTDFPQKAAVHLRSIELEPSHIMSGISAELPNLVKSCLTENGYEVAGASSEDVYELDIFIHTKKWQYDYRGYESVTLRLLLSSGGNSAAYRLYTEDTEKSIDSFSWTLSLLRDNISELTAAIYDED